MTALRCCELAACAWLVVSSAHAQDVPLDKDQDGDGILTAYEFFPGELIDSDLDGILDYLDPDDDGDRLPTRDEAPDPNGDGNPKDARKTTAGLPDYLNPDDDSDSLKTTVERPGDRDRDTDGDGLPDHRDPDDDGDGIPTRDELAGDLDLDGIPDYLDADDDGDGIPTLIECADFAMRDIDGDGQLNCRDVDSDGDGIADSVEGMLDRNGDDIPDFLQPDVEQDQGNVLPDDPTRPADGGARDAGTIHNRLDGAVSMLEDASSGGVGVRPRAKEDGCALVRSNDGALWLALAALLMRRKRSC